MSSSLSFLLVMACALSCDPAAAADKIMPDLFFKITQNLVTPHIEWAKPYYRGKLRALVLAPRDIHRETVELMERLEIDCTPVLLRSETEIYLDGWDWGLENEPRAKKAAVLSEINAALDRDYDLLIMAKVATDKLPADVIQRIEDKIRKGCGLVFIPRKVRDTAFEKQLFKEKLPDLPPSIIDGIPLEKLPGLHVRGDAHRQKDLEALVSAYQYGSGRVVLIEYSDGGHWLYLTPADMDDLSYEYYQAFAIKAILWAGQKESQTLFQDFPQEITGRELAITLRSDGETPLPGPLSLQLSIRSPRRLQRMPDGPVTVPGPYQTAEFIRPVYSEKIEIASAGRQAVFKIPELPEGAYFADVRLLAGGKAVNWAAATYTSTPPLFISTVQCSPETIDCSRPGKTMVSVRAQFNAKADEGVSVHFALFDNFDRLLAEKKVEVPSGAEAVDATIAIEPAAIVCAMLRVRAALGTSRQGEASVKVANLTTVRRPFPDFTFFAWGGNTMDYVARQTVRVNAATGIVDAYRQRGSIAALDVSDARFVPDVVALRGHLTKVSEGVSCSTPLWGDPEYRRQLFQTVKKGVESGLKFDTYAFLLGDESRMLDARKDAKAITVGRIADFRAWLQGRYGTIEELNKRWGTHHVSFDQINPISRNTMLETAGKDGNYAPLVDLWAFNFWTYADTVRFVKDVLRAADPRARLGFSTPLWNHLHMGYYWEKIAPQLDFFTPYYGQHEGDQSSVDTAVAFARPGTALSCHAGSYIYSLPDEEFYTVTPHSILLKGMSNFFWYFLTTGTEGCMSASLDYYPQTERSVKEVKRIKAGLGRLILGSQREKRKIAVLFSTPSYLFSFVCAGAQLPWNFNAAMYALRRLGYQADVLSPAQLLDGALANYQVLVLPVAQCLGDDEAEKIRQFARAGGLVIADIRPGVADAYGKFRSEGALADLFGVRWNDLAANPLRTVQLVAANKAPELSMDYNMSGDCDGVKFSTVLLERLGIDPALAVTRAKAGATCCLPKDSAEKLKKALAAAEGSAKPLSAQNAKALQERIEQFESASASIPFVLVNRYGAGSAVYLNNSFSSFAAAGLADVLDAVLTSHGMKPPVAITKGYRKSQPGRWLPEFFYDGFRDGQARYFGFVKKKSAASDEGSNAYYGVVKGGTEVSAPKAAANYEIAIDFGTEGHVYEPLSGKYLGLRKSVSDEFGPSVAKWYAVLPYQVEGLKVSLGDKEVQPGQTITGAVEVLVRGSANPQRHVINVQVLDKDGRSIMYLLRNLDTVDGKATFSIPTALNDDVRNWTLVLTDAATGVTARLKLE